MPSYYFLTYLRCLTSPPVSLLLITSHPLPNILFSPTSPLFKLTSLCFLELTSAEDDLLSRYAQRALHDVLGIGRIDEVGVKLRILVVQEGLEKGELVEQIQLKSQSRSRSRLRDQRDRRDRRSPPMMTGKRRGVVSGPRRIPNASVSDQSQSQAFDGVVRFCELVGLVVRWDEWKLKNQVDESERPGTRKRSRGTKRKRGKRGKGKGKKVPSASPSASPPSPDSNPDLDADSNSSSSSVTPPLSSPSSVRLTLWDLLRDQEVEDLNVTDTIRRSHEILETHPHQIYEDILTKRIVRLEFVDWRIRLSDISLQDRRMLLDSAAAAQDGGSGAMFVVRVEDLDLKQPLVRISHRVDMKDPELDVIIRHVESSRNVRSEVFGGNYVIPQLYVLCRDFPPYFLRMRGTIHKILSFIDAIKRNEKAIVRFSQMFELPKVRTSLLREVITHPSFATEYACMESVESYDRLEFLGDAVLGMIVAHALNDLLGGFATSKEIRKHHSALVSNQRLEEIGRNFNLVSEFMLIREGHRAHLATSSHKTYADVIEALIAALFLDAGLTEAARFVGRFLVVSICRNPQVPDVSEVHSAAYDFPLRTQLLDSVRNITQVTRLRKPELFLLALVHGTQQSTRSRCLADERYRAVFNNQRLYFLGKQILRAITSHALFLRHPEGSPSLLSTSREVRLDPLKLAEAATRAGIQTLLPEGSGPDMLQEVFVTLVCALYLDQGGLYPFGDREEMDVKGGFVHRYLMSSWNSDLDQYVNPKLLLQKHLGQDSDGRYPRYVVDEDWKSLRKEVKWRVTVRHGGDCLGFGFGETMKMAEIDAAEYALNLHLNLDDDGEDLEPSNENE